MKGVILAGGTGSRLLPLTKVTNKHLLPVYNKPMIYYPIQTLKHSGIDELLIVLGGNSVGDFVNLLGDGSDLGVSITYRHQAKADGIAGALKLAKDFVGDDDFVVCLGDNIFENSIPCLQDKFSLWRDSVKPTAMVFLSPTDRPSSFGVPAFDDKNNIIRIDEKPKNPASNFAVTGLYVYDKNIWHMIDSLKMSNRGEFEITDINNWYISNGLLNHVVVSGWWHDAGSIPSLMKASQLAMERETQNANKW